MPVGVLHLRQYFYTSTTISIWECKTLSAFTDKLSLRYEIEGKAFPNRENLKIYKSLRECFTPTSWNHENPAWYNNSRDKIEQIGD